MTVFSVKERNTIRYTAVIKDEEGNAIPAAQINSLVLTLYDISSSARTIINSRNAQNVLNANNVTVDSSGNVEWEMQPADNQILNANLKVEHHRALFKFTWSGGNKQGTHEVEFAVQNAEKLS